MILPCRAPRRGAQPRAASRSYVSSVRTPIPSRIACPSSRLAAPRTAAASRDADADRDLGVEEGHPATGRRERHGAAAVADRDVAGLAAGAAQRHRAGLGGDGHDGRLQARERVLAERGVAAPAAGRLDLGQALGDLRRGQLAVAAGAEDGRQHGHARRGQRGRAGEHEGIGERAAQAGLVAVGEDVAADVEQDHGVAAQPAGRDGEALGHRRGARMRVDQDGRLAEQLGHPALGEAEAARARGIGPGQRDGRMQRLGAGHLVEAPRTRERVDRAPLPGQAAEDGRRAARLGHRGGRKRAHDVTAAADPQAQDPGRAAEGLLRRGGQTSAGVRSTTPPSTIASISS